MPRSKKGSDRAFSALMAVIAFSIIGLTALYFYELTRGSFPVIREGLTFLVTSRWPGDAGGVFGALPMIYGSLLTSAIALLLGVPVSIGVAVFLSELSPSFLRPPFSFLVEMLAAVPSVVYGLWGLLILAPILRTSVFPAIGNYLGFVPILSCPTRETPCQYYGESILTAGIVLAIMIIPIVSSVSRDALLAVPDSQREAAYALGATKSEAIRISVLSYARSGILASIFLGLGRAFGETIAVTMVIGNTPLITGSVFSPGYTLASLIANEFTEATTPMHISALFEAGLILLVVVFVTNITARVLISRLVKSREAASYL